MNLMDEKLIWMTEKDFHKVLLAVNIATNCVGLNPQIREHMHDLDGEDVSEEQFEHWDDAVHEANLALGRAKYVPEDTIDKLRLIVKSE